MCGIAGICNLDGPRGVSPETLWRMTAALRHRGPDADGYYVDDWTGLGHARLSIVDLAGGTQPIHNEDESLWIVYNGEVFNYPELRAELLERGHRLYTATDTETIVHLYEERGPACLHALNGQFALAIWDARARELFLARDRVGIRPLHYTVTDDGRLVFASEIASIFRAGGVPREIDPVALDQIFTFWTTLPGRTAFRGIRELPPGHYLHVRDGAIAIARYWDVPFSPPADQSRAPSEEIVGDLRDLLRDAVRVRLRADVPVGCYLSGGLDSAAIATLAVADYDRRVRTFGIRFEETEFDEGEHQRRMAAHLRVRHEELLAGNRAIAAAFPAVVRHCEKPLLRTAPAPLFLLSRLVRDEGYKVVLTGEGADEMLAGYNIFRETQVRRFWARRPDSKLRARLAGSLYPYLFKDARLQMTLPAFFRGALERTDDPFFSHRIRWKTTSRAKRFFSGDLRAAIGDYAGDEELAGSLPAAYGSWDPIARAQYLETVLFLSNYLLSSQGDRVAMAHSVEIRLPFLDVRVIEFLGRVPTVLKLFGMEEKHLLKRAFRGDLPREIIERPKQPYRAPIAQSLIGAEAIQEVLSERKLAEHGLFDPKKVRALVEKLERAERPAEVEGMALAGIASTQLLVEHLLVGGDRAAAGAGERPRDGSLTFDRRVAVPSS